MVQKLDRSYFTAKVNAAPQTGGVKKLDRSYFDRKNTAPTKTTQTTQPTQTTAAPSAAAATVRQPTLSLAGGKRSTSNAGGFSHSSGKIDLPSFGERVGKTLVGAAKQSGGSYANAAGTLYDAGKARRETFDTAAREDITQQYETARSDLAKMQEDNARKAGTWSENDVAAQEAMVATLQARYDAITSPTVERAQRGAADETYKIADKLASSGVKDVERAKEGLGAFGQTLVDAGASTAQSVADNLVGRVTGVGMLPFVTRAFGGATQEARQGGADLKEQLLYGGAQAAKEYVTEKLFGIALPQQISNSGGAFDDIVANGIRNVTERLAKTEGGQRALGGLMTWLAGGVSESLEEGIGALMENTLINPTLRSWNPDTRTAQEKFEDGLYDMLVGGVSGLLGVNNLLTYQTGGQQTQQTPTQQTALPAPQTAQERAEALGDETTPPTAENAPTAQETDALGGGKRIPLDRYATEENIDGVSQGLNDGSLAVDAQGNIYRTNEAEHIDQRTSGTVGARSVKAFQFDHPEVHQYYRETAAELLEELNRAEKGGEIVHVKAVGVGDDQYMRMKRLVSDRIATLLDDERLSYNDIERALEAIINNHGQENFAAAKRVELMLDDMLSNGYRSVYGEDVAPNEAYLAAKRAIPGASEITAPEELPIWDIEEAAPEVSRETLARNVAQVRDAAAALGKNGSRALSMVYNEETARSYAPEDAVRDFYQVYNAALGGKQSDNTTAPEHVRLAAQNAGERDARAASQARYFGEQAGLVRDAGWRKAKLTSKQSYALDALAKVTGTQIKFADTVEDGGANASYSNGVITLALDARDPVMTSVVHETIHRIRETAPEAYEALASFVQDSMSEESTELNLAARGELYETDDTSLLTEETVADAFGTMLEKSDVLERFTAEHRSAAQRIRDALHDLLVKISRALGSKDVTLSENQRAAFRDLEGKTQEMETLFTEALKATQGKALQTQGNGATIGDTKFSKYWRPKLTAVEWELLSRRMEQEIADDAHTLDEATKWAYANEKGVQVFALYGIGDGTEATVLYAAGGKDAGKEYGKFQSYLEGRKNGTHKSAKVFDRWLNGLRSEARNGSGHLHDVTDGRTNVGNVRLSGGTQKRTGGEIAGSSTENSGGVKFSLKTDSKGRKLTEAQEEYFKDSKVRDKNGNLLVVYHGTGADFTVFDSGRVEQNFENRGGDLGFYFTPYAEDARGYARNATGYTASGKVMEVYLNLENPLIVEDSGWGDAIQQADTRHGDLKRWAKEGGHDGIIVKSMDIEMDNGEADAVYIAFSPEQVKNIDNKTPTSDPDIRHSKSTRDVLDAYVAQYGEIPAGEKPSRTVSLPRQTAKDKYVSQTIRTVLEAKATPDVMIPTIEDMVARGDFSYDRYTDKQAVADAEATIQKESWQKSLNKWKRRTKTDVSKEAMATGWALYNNAATSGDVETALDILNSMVSKSRNAAQALQAVRILKKQSPSAQLYGVQRSVEALQEDLQKEYGDRAPDLKIDTELAKRYMNAATEAERDAALREIYRDIGRQMPSRFTDRWNAWRYLSMLGNPRTHVRNIVGNAGFAPLVGVKNLVGAGLESAANAVTGGKVGRTKAVLTTKDTDLVKAAWNDYANIEEIALSGGKYDDSAVMRKEIEEGRRIFGNTGVKAWDDTLGKGLETARKFNSKALDREDVWFSKPHYASALAQYCKANGITASQIASGKGLEAARNYAVKEAQKATYRDTNDFSQMVSRMGRRNGGNKNKAEKLGATILEGILPFRKTPANILARGVEYSPIELMKSISYDLYQVKKGSMEATEMLDHLSTGLTGTGVMMLGAYMAAEGLMGMKLRGGGGDDEEKDFDELRGHQDYSLELPDGTSITLDWLAPEVLPLFVGTNLIEQMQESRDGELAMADVLEAISNVSDPLLQMSCLQSLNDLFDSVGYAASGETSALASVVSSAATSYLTQALPTLLGQIERTGEGYRMTTYTDKNEKMLTGDMQYALGRASSRLPGWDYDQIPYIDAWGRTEYPGDVGKRAFDNFLNPAYTSRVESSAMENELERLYDATDEAGVLPERAERYFSVGGERKDLTGEEYVRYASARGQTAYRIVNELTGSAAYRVLSDSDKAAAVEDAYKVAKASAKMQVSDYKPDGMAAKCIEAKKKYNIDEAQFILLYQQQGGIESLKGSDGKTISLSEGLQKMELVYQQKGLSDKQRAALFEAFNVPESIRHYNKALVSEKLKAMRKQAK